MDPTQRRRRRVALPAQDSVEDCHPRHPRQVADHVMQLHVHLRQRFLHQPNLIAGALHQPPLMPQQRARRTDLLLGTKRRPQQPHRMQVLQEARVG